MSQGRRLQGEQPYQHQTALFVHGLTSLLPAQQTNYKAARQVLDPPPTKNSVSSLC